MTWGPSSLPYLWVPARADTSQSDDDIVRILGKTSLRHYWGDDMVMITNPKGLHWALLLYIALTHIVNERKVDKV